MSVFLLLPFFPISASGVRFFKGTRKWKRVLEQLFDLCGRWNLKTGDRGRRTELEKRNNKQTAVKRGAWSDSEVKGLQSVWVWVGESRWRGLVMLFVVC
jgi:hypothetical protein